MPMKIPKPTESARALFASLVPNDDRVQVKPMFGNLGAFINGNVFIGVFGADVGVKLGTYRRACAARTGWPSEPSQ
jgi:hypothetical protein